MGTEPTLIGLFGLFGIGNIGNDGSLEAMVRVVQRVAPQERMLCICGNPAVVEKVFGLEAVPIRYKRLRSANGGATAVLQRAAGKATLWFHAVRQLRRLKVLIVPGMGVLDDFGVGPLGWPHDILSWCFLARLMGVKVIFVSVGAGPIRHPVSRWMMKAAARTAHYRSYRDTVSKAFMESIGFDAARDDPIYPDIAFRLAAPASTRTPAEEGRPLTIGVGVMTYNGWRNDSNRGADVYTVYLEKITRFVLWLLDRGHAVRVLMGDQADRRAVEDLLQAVRSRLPGLAEGSIMFTPAWTLHDIMRQIADTDLVVATRYHNVVCALRVGKPTISIGYAEKNDVLLAEMGLGDYCQDIERLDLAHLKGQTTRLLSERLLIEERIRQAGARFQRSLREQEDLLESLLFGDARAAHCAKSLGPSSEAM